MKLVNFAPIYCGLYPELANVCRKHGYALAVHGSLGRDFDLICVPWTQIVSSPEEVILDMINQFALKCDMTFTEKYHGRKAYTLNISFGECFIDLSFLPIGDLCH